MTRVLCIWAVRAELREHLRRGLAGVPGVELVFPEDTAPEALNRLAPDADIIVGWRPTRGLLDAARRLRLFINPGAGVQHLVPLFRNLGRDIMLVNGHGNSYFTAQHAVGLLLALLNKVVLHDRWMREGRWRTGDDVAISIPLRGRTVGLLGYGHVNRKVHRFLAGFDVEFRVLRRRPGVGGSMPVGSVEYGPTGLGEFLDAVDTLVIGLPQTDDTVGLIGREELDRLGRDGVLVNIGRGAVVDEEALYTALKEGRIAGAAIDVWYDYRPEPDADGRKFPYRLPFHELDNVVLSPHRGASPLTDLARWDEVVENITRFAAGRRGGPNARGETQLLNIVDIEAGY